MLLLLPFITSCQNSRSSPPFPIFLVSYTLRSLPGHSSCGWPHLRPNYTRTTATVGAAASIPIEPKKVVQKDPDMSRKYYVETTSNGRPHFVKIKRSRSHHHHHDDHYHESRHHHRRHSHWEDDYCPPQYYKISREEWDVLKERERLLNEHNKALVEENKCLRNDLVCSQEEVTKLQQCVIPDLQARNETLWVENGSLRRSIDVAAEHASRHHVELERLQKEKKGLEEENSDLRSRVRHLSRQLDGSRDRQVQELVKDVRYWKHKFAEVKEVLGLRTERMEAYEDILRRRGIIC